MEFKNWLSDDKLSLRFIASTPQELSRGLMHQDPLKSNEGALFVYPKPVDGRFWNKNVSFPIDVGFFDEDKRLIDVRRLEAGQEEAVGSSKPFQFVLEAPEGYFRNKNGTLDQFIHPHFSSSSSV